MNIRPFQDLIRRRCGLVFEGVSERPLQDGVAARRLATGAKDESAYFLKLSADEREFYELVSLVTINETYFFREPEQLSFFADVLVPRLLARRGPAARLTILSAGCSTGEEAYSIAIALAARHAERAAQAFSVIGGDIDKAALHKARAGIYPPFSFRGASPDMRERWFRDLGGSRWKIDDAIARMVQFKHLNLLSDSFPPELRDIDVAFLRNVSIYFDGDARKEIQRRLAGVMKEDGFLLTGSAETLANDFGIFSLREERGSFFFARQGKASPPRERGAGAVGSIGAPRPAASQGIEKALPSSATGLSGTTGVSGALRAELPERGFPSDARSGFEHGELEAIRQWIREKEYDKALSGIERLSPGGGLDARLLLRSYIHLQRREYDEAEAIARDLLAAEPWSPDVCLILGLAARRRDRVDEATKFLKQAVYTVNSCWPAHFYLAEIYRGRGEPAKAAREYLIVRRALEDPEAAGTGLAVIPLELPIPELKFLCERHIAAMGQVYHGA